MVHHGRLLEDGGSSSSIPVPATPDLNGLGAHSQLWALDPLANPAGLVTSRAVTHGWTAPWTVLGVGRVYLSGSLGAAGTAATNNGLVTRFDL